MKKKIFFLMLAFLCCCHKKDDNVPSQSGRRPKEASRLSDKEANGGLLRFSLQGKSMHDSYFVAQFTPKGVIFRHDNLQLFNYNRGSDKYPQFLINIDYDESELKNWEGHTFPLDFLVFTAAQNTTPLNSRGQMYIQRVSQDAVEGHFSGELVNPITKKSFAIRGEFKGIVELNI
jgi:hypothetical protein